MSVVLKLPLNKPVPREEINISAVAKLIDASLKGVLPKIDITGGQFDLASKTALSTPMAPPRSMASTQISPGTGTWERTANNRQRSTPCLMPHNAKNRCEFDDFLSGPVSVSAKIADLSDPDGTIAIDANLAKADMHLGVISWSREAQPKTHATFIYRSKGEKGRRVEDLDIEGPGVTIKGDIGLDANGGLRTAKLTEIDLSDENRFALAMTKDEDGASIEITGDSFDARPLINSMFGSNGGEAAGDDTGPAQPLSITANVDRVYTYRGEIVTGVTAQIQSGGGKVQSAEISGTFLSGQPIALHIVPVNGGRELRLAGRDGGAALRAPPTSIPRSQVARSNSMRCLQNDPNSSVKNGQLVLRNFEVRNEAALAQLDTKGKPSKPVPAVKAWLSANSASIHDG